MKRGMQKRVISFLMTLLMVVGLLPINLLIGGVTEVLAGTGSITGWTNLLSGSDLDVTVNNDGSITLKEATAEKTMQTGNMSALPILTIGEATTDDITISADVVVDSIVSETNNAGFAIGVIKEGDASTPTAGSDTSPYAIYAYAAYRAKGNIVMAYTKTDGTYGSSSMLGTADKNKKYTFEFIKTSSDITINVTPEGETAANKNSGNSNYKLDTANDKVYPFMVIDGATVTLSNLKVTVDGEQVYPIVDTGTAVNASIKYDGTEISVLSGGWAADSNTLSFSPATVSFTAEPETSKLSVETGATDVLGGTYTAEVDTTNSVIKVYNSGVDSGTKAIASLPYKIAGQLSVMQVKNSESASFKSDIFGASDLSVRPIMSPNNYIMLTTGEGTKLEIDGSHNLKFGKSDGGSSISFTMKIAANAMGVVTLSECAYSSATVDVVAGGETVVSNVSASAAKDGDNVVVYEYRNTTTSPQEIVVTLNGGGASYVHGITCEVKEIPQEATVQGSISTVVAGGTLTFKAASSYTTTVQADGTYSIQIPIGAKYNVELSGVAGYRLDNATVDLTSVAAGSTVADQNFDPLFWDTSKTATVTVGGTTFTITPGALETDDFNVTVSSGDGNVEIANSEKAIVWADLGGAGSGSASGAVIGGGATGSINKNTITINFENTQTLPAGYILEIKDNSASGVPVKDGATKNYDFSNESIVSKMYTSNTKLMNGKTIKSTDKLVTLTGNKGIYYNGSHGIYISDTDTVSVEVAGNAQVSFTLCQYGQTGATLSATAPKGNIYLSTDSTANSVPMKTEKACSGATFIYEGDATTLTFTVSSPSGTSYIHSITVTNEAEKTTTNESAVKVKPEALTDIGVPGNLTVTPNGQKLNLVQTGGQLPNAHDSNFTQSGVSFYAFPQTADWNKLELEVKINSIEANSNSNGAFVGAINTSASNNGEAVATVGVRKNTGLRGIYSKAAEYAGGGQANATITAGDTIKYTVYKADDAFYIETAWSEGTHKSTFKYNDSSFAAFEDKGSATPVYIGLMLAGVNADVMNMVYTDKDGNVLYDQNAYYNPLGEAPEAKSVTAKAAEDRTYIDVTWTGTQVYGDGKFVLQVSKDGGEWTDVSDTITEYSYQYPVSSDASGVYKFRVCGTLGNSGEQSVNNRNTYVESNDVTIVAALAAPEVTVNTVSPADRVRLSWTASPQATSYEVYRRSSDEEKSTLIATVTETSYTDTSVTAEVPYYYYVIAKSADNSSNPQKEVWTLPTAGTGGEYQYDEAVIAITKKSYDTVFNGKITVEGVVTAPGKVSLLVNGTEAATANVAAANGTFSFTDVAVAEGRNDVEVILEFDAGKKVRKALNFVYLTNYDYVVDAAFTGTAGDTSEYGVPQYKTIGEAIAAIGSGNSQRKVIFIREGSYKERLDIYTPYLSLIGEDSTKTIIHNYPGDFISTGHRGESMGDRAAMRIRSDATGFSAENLTIQNDWEYKGDGSISNESADVIHSESEGAMYVNVRFLGYQDTVCANKNHQYYYKCYITGNVDFIYGNSGLALFNDCDIVFRYNANKNSGYVTAMKNSPVSAYDALFNECRITGENGCSGTGYYLGRPWGEEAATVFIDCYMSSIINRNIGWTTWGGKEFSTDPAAFEKVKYYEHGSYGTGAMVNSYRRQLSDTQAAAMLSVTGLGWDPYSSIAAVSSGSYIGSKKTTSTDKVVTDEFVSDTYSAYEGDDTGLGKYNQEGYAQSAVTTGGGLLKETNSNYYKVATAKEFMDALAAIQSGKRPSVIEITEDLNLGSNEIADFASYGSLVSAHNAPLTHPELLNTGVSKINLRGFSDLTIFSSNGSSINHASLDIRESSNIIIRNIIFDELWEWDEKDKGDYDTNDWDFVVIEGGSDRIWIDHCTFYKAYDGVVDIKTDKTTPTNVTVSWCEFLPGSENNTFFNAMMDTMAAAPEKYPYYKSLLDSGMTQEQIWWYAYGQKKTHLLGQNDDAVQNTNLNVTFANNYYYNSMDRMPRLRFGNAHVYNCIMDAQELYDARASITNPDAAKHIVSNGASSTCDGQLLLENSYINGIINALNSGNGSSPSGYINAVNSLYYVGGTRYALVPKVNTTKPGEQVKVLDADAFIADLPYSGYALYDAAELSTLVVPFAGAGKLNLTVLQWEKSSYKDTTWVVPDDDSNHDDENLPDFVATEDGVVIIGEGVLVSAGNGITFKNNKGNIIKSGKIYVKAVEQKTSSLAGKINLGSEDKVQYYDVTLVDEDGNTVTIASGKLDLTFAYPSGTNRSDYSFKVYHGLDNKKIEQLGTSCIDTGVKVTVDSLSPFAIVYTENEDGEYEGDTVQSVKTGDSTPLIPLAVMMFISAGICAAIFFKKKENA